MNLPEEVKNQSVPMGKFLEFGKSILAEIENQNLIIHKQQEEINCLKDQLSTEVILNAPQVKAMKKAVEIRARELLKTDEAYKVNGKKLIWFIWTDLKDAYLVGQYREIPRVKFTEAMEFVKTWYPQSE